MKRVGPHSLSFSTLIRFLKTHAFKIVFTLAWVIIFSGISYKQLTHSTKFVTYTYCEVKQDIKKGEIIKKDWVTEKTISADAHPFVNIIPTCKIDELYTIPVQKNLVQHDVLQLSDFETKPSEIHKSLVEHQVAIYIPVKDIHTLPANIQVGQTLTVYAKDKKADQSVVLLKNIKVIDLLKTKDDENHEFVSQFAVAVDEQQALSLTKAISDSWTLITAAE